MEDRHRVFACAIVGASLALWLASPIAVAEVTVNMIDLRRACMAPRSFAMAELLGANYTPEQANIVDARVEQELIGKTPQALAEAYQAFERNTQSERPAADRYAQCIYGERLRQLDPNADLHAVRRGDYGSPGTVAANDPWSSAQRRTGGEGAAGVGVLSGSADPAARAAREREEASRRERSEQRLADRRAASAAFWRAAVQAAESYAAAEAARRQAEAEATARAQAGLSPPTSQAADQRRSSAPPPQQSPTTVGSSAPGPRESNTSTFLHPETGRRCVEEVSYTPRRTYRGATEWIWVFQNICDRQYRVRVHLNPVAGNIDRQIQQTGILPGTLSAPYRLTFRCTNEHDYNGCNGFRLYEVY